MSVPLLSFDQVVDGLLSKKQPYFSNYLAMYSSWYGGIVTDQALMMLPIDDHMVHRGDGVFEAIKCTNWNIYLLDRHLDRLNRSLATSYLQPPVDRSSLVQIIRETVLAGNAGDCLIRVFISRGPGSFGVSPYESIASQLYVVVTAFQPPAPEKYEKGITLATSSVPIKSDYFATAKHCNYLPNVLMKKEATDAGAYFPVSLDENGFLAESATENIGIVTKKGELLVPRFSRILRGTTVTRALELAALVTGVELTAVAEADITREQAYEASEILAFGTTFGVLPIVEYDGKKIGDGRPGKVFRRFLDLISEDQSGNRDMFTPVRS
ncbi:MAG: aminotransferase class IV [Syntrophobacteraceae bacterium]